MAIDPSKFHLINVADTCSVWNILSSPRLNAVAKEARCDFCVTSFVQYECLIKPRKSILPSEQTLMDRLKAEQRRGAFQAQSCSIEDLQAIEILEKRRNLGKGELSSIAFAMKIRQGFITDDRKACQLAKDSGHPHAQTTPHLFSWLIFTGRLGDSDKDTVIAQHVEAGRQIAQHLQRAYEMALQCRLNATVRP
ncbi:MAG: hypothetical protein ACRYGA_09390 [Janthinobacterium lividum]